MIVEKVASHIGKACKHSQVAFGFESPTFFLPGSRILSTASVRQLMTFTLFRVSRPDEQVEDSFVQTALICFSSYLSLSEFPGYNRDSNASFNASSSW